MLIQIRAGIVAGEARLEVDSNKPYSESEALAAFRRLSPHLILKFNDRFLELQNHMVGNQVQNQRKLKQKKRKTQN